MKNNYKKIVVIFLTFCFIAFGVLGAFSAEEAATTTTQEQATTTTQSQPDTQASEEASTSSAPEMPAKPSRWTRLLQFIVNAIILGIVGILLLIIGYYIWEMITVNYSVREQLVDHKNTAVAIVTASFVLGMAIVIGIALTKI